VADKALQQAPLNNSKRFNGANIAHEYDRLTKLALIGITVQAVDEINPLGINSR
jgi:hypothetical protein